MDFQFAVVLEKLPYLLGGAWISLQIAFLSFTGGMCLGLIGASVQSFAPTWARRCVNGYVGFFMNTPQLVQIYFIFFALPDLGVIFTPYEAVLLGMMLNAGAYLTEIQRAGFKSVQVTELEAAETLGFSRVQSIRYVIVPHIMKVMFPPLSNQYILMTLGTSMAAIFGLEELTGRAFNLNAETFRSVEIFTVTAGVYIVITLLATLSLSLVGRYGFRAKMRLF